LKTNRINLEIALKEISFITDNISLLSETHFENNPVIQRAIVLSLIIIGEETNKVSKELKLKYTDVPWKLISGIRNKMVHNYDGIDTAIVWRTITDDIPELKIQIEKILSEEKEL
jgi:uncharacterized protein with HEPN domain